MIDRVLSLLVTFGLLIVCTGIANASLTKIGTAELSYTGDTEYNLLWDSGQNLVWLDHTHGGANLFVAKMWTYGLKAHNLLTLNLYSNYNVSWTDENWRVPTSGTDPSTTSEGPHRSSSEIGRLFYGGLGFEHAVDEDGRRIPLTKAQLNSKEFDNLATGGYWTNDEVPGDDSWYFYMAYGSLNGASEIANVASIAVRSAQVSAVPVPGTILLLGSGLLGLAAISRRKK